MINKLQFRAVYATRGYEASEIDKKEINHPDYSPYNKIITPIDVIMKDPSTGKTRRHTVQSHKVLPNDIYRIFLQILNPVYDAGITEKMVHKVLDHTDCEFREDLFNMVSDECLKFANEYGCNLIADVDKLDWDNYDPDEGVGFQTDMSKVMKVPTTQTMIAEALDLRMHVLNDWKYQSSLTKRLNSAYPLEIKIISKFKDIVVGLTNSVWGSIWWSWFYSDLNFYPKPCQWCGAPILHDARATFCQPPRQCKNRFHNYKAKLEREKKSANKKKK